MKYIAINLLIIYAGAVFFFLPVPSPLFAETNSLNLRILTIPISNETNNDQLNPLCGFIDDQIYMTLNILGNYDLYHMEETPGNQPSNEIIKQFVASNSIDKIIYGSLKSSNGKRKNPAIIHFIDLVLH